MLSQDFVLLINLFKLDIFKRLNITDLKGPLLTVDNNHYFLSIVDESSKQPPLSSHVLIQLLCVIKCVHQLFSIYEMSAYIDSDRMTSFK